MSGRLARLPLDFPDLAREVDRLGTDRFYFFVTPDQGVGEPGRVSGKSVMIAMHSTIMRKKGAEARAT
jgi:hypothetical protein